MVQSLNTKVDLVVDATSFSGLADYGQIMIGDKGFEFYNSNDYRKFIQIPWEEVDYVMASVMFKGKWIPRFAVVTKKNGKFIFSSRDNKALLRAVNKYVASENLVRSLSFLDIIKRGIKSLFSKKIV